MITFQTGIKKFGSKGEKTGWTYIDIPEKIANKLKPDCKKSFRVKGKMDEVEINAVALTPMGDGNFILAINAALRKSLKKIDGATVIATIEADEAKIELSPDMMECLQDEPIAFKYFDSLPGSHKNWFSNWVKSAKTITTSTKRIATVVKACQMKMSFSEMMKSYKEIA